MARNADFDQKTRLELERRVNSRCSNPACGRVTSGPKVTEDGVINIGKAAHICAASKGGPRYDPSMTNEERKSISNGIWLCSVCHDLVDNDEKRFPVECLRQWKENAEAKAERRLLRPFKAENASSSKRISRISRKQMRNIAVAALFIVAFVILCIVSVKSLSRRTEYREYISAGNFEVRNENLLEAAEEFHYAALVAYNDQTRLEAMYYEGMAYMVYGLYTPEEFEKYAHSALNIYSSIIEHFDETDSEYYIDAIADSCSVYYTLNYPATDPNWSQMVAWVEQTYDPLSMDGNMAELPIALEVKLAMLCAHYYDRATEEEFSRGVMNEGYIKSMQYYGQSFILSVLQNESVNQGKYDGESVIGFLREYTNRMLNYYGTGYILNHTVEKEEAIEKIVEATAHCIEVLDSGFVKKGSYEYIELQTNIGKALCMTALIDLDKYGSNMQKAYETLMPLVEMQISPQYTQSVFSDCALYVVQTGQYTSEDLKSIVRLYELSIGAQRLSGNTDALIVLMESACAACSTAIALNGTSEELLHFAEQTASELERNWGNYISVSTKENIERIKSAIQ